jgi:phage-related minor tail protein
MEGWSLESLHGMLSSTTAVGINWIRVLAANLAQATSTTAVVLLLLALSEPIGYGWGIGFSTLFAIGMIVIWVLGDPVVFDTLGGWAGSIKTWCGSSWDSLKQGVNARWDSTKQNVSAGWDSIKQRVNAAPRLQQRPRAQP